MRDVLIGLVMLAGAGLYWYGADGIPISPLDGAINAAAMPKTLATALAILAVLLIVRALAVMALARRAEAGPAPGKKKTPTSAHLRAVGLLVIGIGYLLILNFVGYPAAVTLLIIAVAIYVGMEPSFRLVGVAIGLAVAYYVIFVQLLGIPLPDGAILAALGI